MLFKDLFNLFYPELCACCGNSLHKEESILCFSCDATLPITDFHIHKDNEIEKIFWARIPLERGASFLYFKKGGKVQNLMHNLKYNGLKEAGVLLGKKYGELLVNAGTFPRIDTIIPVPLHPKRQRKRGFNQSAEFGTGLSKSIGVPLELNNLVRIKKSESQTRKSRIMRWENVADIFSVLQPEALTNKNILLVDDVITTGATLESCAQALLNLDVGIKINIATIAFAS